MDVQISHDRITRMGRIYFGIGYGRIEDDFGGISEDDLKAFLRWSSR